MELVLPDEFTPVMERLLAETRRRVYIITYIFSFSPYTRRIVERLGRLCRAGKQVKIFLNGVSGEALKFNKPVAEHLSRRGCDVRLSKKFHHIKLYIVDDHVIVGSHNMSGSGASRLELSFLFNDHFLAERMAELAERIIDEDTSGDSFEAKVGSIRVRVLYNVSALSEIRRTVSTARRRISIMTYIATVSNYTRRIYDDIIRRRVPATILLNGAQALACRYNKPVCEYLSGHSHIRVALSRAFIHTKLYIVDGNIITGSHNLTSASIAGRMELNVVLENPRLASVLSGIVDKFYERYGNGCECTQRPARPKL